MFAQQLDSTLAPLFQEAQEKFGEATAPDGPAFGRDDAELQNLINDTTGWEGTE